MDRFVGIDGMVVYDIPSAPASGGGTRLASDVDEAEMLVLARAMTYKLAVLRLRVGGAKIGLRAGLADRGPVIDRFREEISALLESGRLMTGPDLGTCEEDFAGLPTPGGSAGLAATAVDGLPVEELLTGVGLGAAVATAVGGVARGRSVAIEGFGKMGASIARDLEVRGACIVAVSTVAGCAIARPGTCFPVSRLLAARERWGDDLVHHLDVDVQPSSALWDVRCDVLVPGARPGALDAATAERIRARVVVPISNAPYTTAGLATLRARGVVAHADFVCGAGGAMAYLTPSVSRAPDVDVARRALSEIMSTIVRRTMAHPGGPYAGAVAHADHFLATWLDEADRPAGPPLVAE